MFRAPPEANFMHIGNRFFVVDDFTFTTLFGSIIIWGFLPPYEDNFMQIVEQKQGKPDFTGG